MNRVTWSLVGALAATLAGCEGPGEGAYGFPEQPPAVNERAPRVVELEGALRPFAIGQLDDLTLQPVGANYVESSMVDRVVPGAGIAQTYHFWGTVPALRQSLRAGLREHGVQAFCDDTDLGVAVPYGGSSSLPRGVLLLRGELLDFTYARDEGSDIASANVAWTLVDGDTGRVVARPRHTATVRTDEAAGDDGNDPLRALGERLGAQLLADPAVRSALTSRSWAGPSSVEAGARRTPRSDEQADEESDR